jgi:hypothetical protein
MGRAPDVPCTHALKRTGYAVHSRVEEDYSCARIVTELAKAKTNGNKNAIA